MFEMKEVHFTVNNTTPRRECPVCCQRSVLITCNTISFSNSEHFPMTSFTDSLTCCI